jgi:hypothetical protein
MILDNECEAGRDSVRLKPNHKRILEAALYLIQEGERRRAPVTQYEIVKSLFLADVAHLERYGRPVTFDNYSALEFGPVPEAAYDMLKPAYNPNNHYEQEVWPPWRREHAHGRAYYYRGPRRDPNLRALSKTDIAALSEALDEVKALRFGGVVDKTHGNPAYIEAWATRGDKRSSPMAYAKVMAEPDDVLAQDLAEASQYA